MSEPQQSIPIWFFIGLVLLIYGVLVFGASLFEFIYPSRVNVALNHLHAGIWWGLLMVVMGAAYCFRFRPSRQRD